MFGARPRVLRHGGGMRWILEFEVGEVDVRQAGPPVVKPAAASSGKSGVKSPLPGVILDIKVNVGDTVKKGQVVIILEAMKMENNINADKDGKITAINVSKGPSAPPDAAAS